MDRAKQTHIPFYFVDVFATQPLEGNPLAVVPDADDLDVGTMRRIAREFNQSETTFLLKPTLPATWRLRSFTPTGIEVFGAGHNALGAWWWLAESGTLGNEDGVRQFGQQIGENVLPLEILMRAGKTVSITMEHALPTVGESHPDRNALALALGAPSSDVAHELPAQVVSTGVAHLMVPIRSRGAIDNLAPDTLRLRSELKRVGAQGCYAFCLDPVNAEAVAYARFFNPTAGIWEDPATGSAAGPLGFYLRTHGLLTTDGDYLIEQGYSMGRPSRIRVSLRANRISIAGSAVITAEGTLRFSELQS